MRRAQTHKTEVPVVIVGGSLNSLGVTRSLSRAGLPISVVETSAKCPARWSRLCRFVKVASLDGRPLVDALIALASQIGQPPVLILTDDRAVETVSRFQAELAAWYRFTLPPRDVVLKLADKIHFQKFAEQAGLPVPKSAGVTKLEELSRLETLSPPLVVKPTGRRIGASGRYFGAAQAESLEAASAIASQMLQDGLGLIAQEWITGPDTGIYFCLFACDRQSKVIALFTGRKVVCDPPLVGCTALCVPATEQAEELERMTRQFIELVGYRGIGSLEFKRDEKSGRFVLVEPTVGRTDWQEEIATLCGVNIPLIVYRAELGQPPEKATKDQVAPIAWRSARRHKPPIGELSPDTRIEGGHFQLNDPLPGVYYYAYARFLSRIRPALKRLVRARPTL